jgi:multicomponent Na+:H+ antiporter subunit E
VTVRYLAYAAGLAVAWVVLWDRPSVANMLAGLVVAALILVAVPLRPVAPEKRRRVRPGALARLIAAALHDVVSSNWAVFRLILGPRRQLRTGVVACPMRTPSAKVLSTVSNILALSPDTTAVQATNDPPTLYVHCLLLHDIHHLDDVRRKVAHLEAAVIAALGTAAERDALDVAQVYQ